MGCGEGGGVMQPVYEVLKGLEPFSLLERDLLELVASAVRPISFEPGAWLLEQGQKPDGSLLIVAEGKASIVAGLDGDEQVLGQCGPGEFAGLTGALTGEPHPVGVRADVRVRSLQVPRESLELCLTSPGFAGHFSQALARRLRRAYTEVAQEEEERAPSLGGSPLRRRIEEVMRTPAILCSPNDQVRSVAEIMRDHRVSSVVVAEGQSPVGIVTSTDLVSKVLAGGLDRRTAVAEIMSHPVEVLTHQGYFYEALILMVRRQIKHLPVVGSDGGLVGMVTLGDLARFRGEGPLAVAERIDHESSVDGLSEAVHLIDDVVRTAMAEGGQPSTLLPIVTELTDRLTRRIIELGIEELGTPPSDWCWLQMGSAGREEQFTRSDQDNGLIYMGAREVADGYFAALAQFVVGGLERCGFARCPGNVMATNAIWRKPLQEWRFEVISMVSRPIPENIRLATIFLDFRAIAGNRALAQLLREQVWMAVESLPIFLHHLVKDDIAHRVPIGPFRTLLTPLWGEHRGQINLKADACVHVVDLLRVLSLRHKVAETSTLGRLKELRKVGALAKDDADWLEIAYQTLMRLRIQDSLKRRSAGEPQRNHIPISELTEPERAALRDALVAVARFQESVGFTMAPGGAL